MTNSYCECNVSEILLGKISCLFIIDFSVIVQSKLNTYGDSPLVEECAVPVTIPIAMCNYIQK